MNRSAKMASLPAVTEIVSNADFSVMEKKTVPMDLTKTHAVSVVACRTQLKNEEKAEVMCKKLMAQ